MLLLMLMMDLVRMIGFMLVHEGTSVVCWYRLMLMKMHLG